MSSTRSQRRRKVQRYCLRISEKVFPEATRRQGALNCSDLQTKRRYSSWTKRFFPFLILGALRSVAERHAQGLIFFQSWPPRQSCDCVVQTLTCTVCGEAKAPDCFAARQRERSTRKCSTCSVRKQTAWTCVTCGLSKPRLAFSENQQHKASKKCMECATPAARSIALGAQNVTCPHCQAKLFPTESKSFCCNLGKYAVHFEDFFEVPRPALMQIFAKTWPQNPPGASTAAAGPSGTSCLTGFSAVCRRFNNMFTLAAHEIQSSSDDKEMRVGNALRPANIRIHGTMYRRVFSAEDVTPLRYLVIDPAERSRQALSQNLDLRLLRSLEKLVLPHNPYMQHIKTNLPGRRRCAEASVTLRWDEGINELAVVTQQHSESVSRAVTFHTTRHTSPAYLHPLNAMYEPMSYPLCYPYGGRGWSPGTSIAQWECNITDVVVSPTSPATSSYALMRAPPE